MGEVTRVVTEHFPAERLPAELREGIATDRPVRVTVEVEQEASLPVAEVMAMFGIGRGVYPDAGSAVRAICELRDEWL
jgi:hypothetical protein